MSNSANLADTSVTNSAAAYYDELYEEKGDYPRMKVNGAPARLVQSDKECLNATVRNISPKGVRILCSREAAATLNPGGHAIGVTNAPQTLLNLKVPINNVLTDIWVQCQLWYFAAVPDGDVAFGLQFLDFAEAGQGELMRFFAEAMEPPVFND